MAAEQTRLMNNENCNMLNTYMYILYTIGKNINESGHEKTCLRGFRTELTQTGLTAIREDRKRLEILDLERRGIVPSV